MNTTMATAYPPTSHKHPESLNHRSRALHLHRYRFSVEEVEFRNFFIEVPKVVKRFKFIVSFALLSIVVMIVLATASFVPYDWRIKDFAAILPMATVMGSHLMLPIVLNTALMTFS
jgi:hypothetical protein